MGQFLTILEMKEKISMRRQFSDEIMKNVHDLYNRSSILNTNSPVYNQSDCTPFKNPVKSSHWAPRNTYSTQRKNQLPSSSIFPQQVDSIKLLFFLFQFTSEPQLFEYIARLFTRSERTDDSKSPSLLAGESRSLEPSWRAPRGISDSPAQGIRPCGADRSFGFMCAA